MQIEENVLLSSLTTFKTGGPARFVITASNSKEVSESFQFAKEKGLYVIPLGGGSNMLAKDEGVDAVFLKYADTTIDATDGIITAGAGAVWDDVASIAAERGWWGVENLARIPGTVGGAVLQNIGAYGAALGDTLVSVEAYDSESGTVRTFLREECALGYRTSLFKQSLDRYYILQATLKLSKAAIPNVGYKDLAARFAGTTPALPDVRAAVAEIRSHKFPNLTEYGCAGSFFLNPIMDEMNAARVQERYPSMPLFSLPEGGVKVPLGWFLDHQLRLRGVRDGNVEAWRDQALVLVAHTGASSS